MNAAANSFFVKRGKTYCKLNTDDILYAKSDGNYVLIKTSNNSFMTKSSLSKWLLKLSDNFIRVHGSYVINIDCLTSFNLNDETIQISEFEIPLGRSYRVEFLNRINFL